MKLKNAYPITKKTAAIKELLPSFNVTSGRIEGITERIQLLMGIQKSEPDKLVTFHIGTTVAEVTPDVAISALESAYKQEMLLAELYNWRLDKALAILSGEQDDEYYASNR